MDRETWELTTRYFDEDLDQQDIDALSNWIKASPENAASFAREALLHNRLQCFAAAGILEPVSNHPNELPQTALNSWVRPMLVMAACLMLAVGAAFWQPWKNDEPQVDGAMAVNSIENESFLTITQLVDAQWAGGEQFKSGSRLGSGKLRLASGIVDLQFDDGVTVTLEGPADYQIVAPKLTRLDSGTLSAVVPPGAEGSKVDTVGATITDLGTAFGVRLDDSGNAEVSVFDGEVDLALHDTDQQQLLREGQTVRIADGRELESVDFNVQPFEKLWPISSGIMGSTGAFRFKPPWPRRLRMVRSDDKIFVMPQGYRAILEEPLDVNISEPGDYLRSSQLTPKTIAAGKRIRSFLLHFHPEKSGRQTRVRGSITFRQPVIGLIVLQDELSESKKHLSPRRSEEIRVGRQLELTGLPSGDQVIFHDDRHTIELNLAAPRRFADVVRVIVEDGTSSAKSKSYEPGESK